MWCSSQKSIGKWLLPGLVLAAVGIYIPVCAIYSGISSHGKRLV